MFWLGLLFGVVYVLAGVSALLWLDVKSQDKVSEWLGDSIRKSLLTGACWPPVALYFAARFVWLPAIMSKQAA